MEKGQNNKKVSLLLYENAGEKVRPFPLAKVPFYLGIYYRLLDWFQNQLDEEMKRAEAFIWLMVPFIAGILFYFQAPQEPNLVVSALATSITAFCTWVFREKGKAFYLSLGFLFFFLSFTLSATHSALFGVPAISEKIILKMEGTIETYEKRADGSKRLVLGNLNALEKKGIQLPKRVRLRVAAKKFKADVNDRLRFLAELSPPPGAVFPGGYDFARNLYFKGIGATGFIYGVPETIEKPKSTFSFSILLRQWRLSITRKISEAFSFNNHDNLSGIASALLVGERGQIKNEVRESLAISGLAHILAISGLHMALVVAIVIMLLRSLFARFESLALHSPIRSISVLGGIATGSFYYFLSGGSVSASRAFIMVTIMAFALLAGRKALSVRNVALAAFILLLVAPDVLLGPGFQMSFAATLSLIAFSSYWISKNENYEEVSKFNSVARTTFLYIKGLLITSLIAGVATGLFAAFHFHKIAPLGLLANLLALPVFTFLIMPFGFFGLLLMPFGYEAYPFFIMGLGIETVLKISDLVNQLTGVYALTGRLNGFAFFIMALLLVLTCLLKSKLKWLTLSLFLFAGLFLKQTDSPTLFISEDGKTVAIRTTENDLLVSGKRAGRFEVKVWRAMLALPERREKKSYSEKMHCSKTHCIIIHEHLTIAHIKKFEVFSDYCNQNALIITPLRAPSYCKKNAQVIDKDVLRQTGAQTGYLEGEALRFETAIPKIKRPWHAHYASAPKAD